MLAHLSEPYKIIEAYQQAIRINPEHTKAWYNLVDSYRKCRQTEKAIKAHQQGTSIMKKYTSEWHDLGNALQ